MKTMIPRNIEKGFFTMNFQIWPFTVSIIQLFIIAIWVWAGLWTFNFFSQWGGSRIIWWVFWGFVILIFLVIAFFEVSELGLIAFIAKMIRTYFLDSPRKFQINYEKIDPTTLVLRRAQQHDDVQKIEQKSSEVKFVKSNSDLLS